MEVTNDMKVIINDMEFFNDIKVMNDMEKMHYHVFEGSYSEVQALLKKGVDLDAKNCYGQTPLMVAARSSHKELVELLIDSGADIHCYDDNGSNVLHYASVQGSLEIIQCLVNKGVAVDVKSTSGTTPLMVAAQSSCRKVVEQLINFGADCHNCNNDGWTVQHFAAIAGLLEIVQFFVNKGVAFDIKNTSGQTPLYMSAAMGKIETADYLIKSGADFNLEDNKGLSSFNFLIRAKEPNVEIIKLCIEKGAYVNPIDCKNLFECPLLKQEILQDVKLCTLSVINKFNNKDLPLLYETLASVQKLPHVDKMKIGIESEMAVVVARAVATEILTKRFCNLMDVYYVFGIACVKFSIEKSNKAILQANPSESSNSFNNYNKKSFYRSPQSDCRIA